MIKATKVDGIYDKDPIIHSSAKRYTKISFDEAINKKLGVMDATAMTLCRDHKLDVGVVSTLKKGELLSFINGNDVGSTVTN